MNIFQQESLKLQIFFCNGNAYDMIKRDKIQLEVNYMMKYIMTFVWSIILISMLNYVVSSVQDVHFNFNHGLIISIPVAIMILIITAIIPNDPVSKEAH